MAGITSEMHGSSGHDSWIERSQMEKTVRSEAGKSDDSTVFTRRVAFLRRPFPTHSPAVGPEAARAIIGAILGGEDVDGPSARFLERITIVGASEGMARTTKDAGADRVFVFRPAMGPGDNAANASIGGHESSRYTDHRIFPPGRWCRRCSRCGEIS